MNATPIDADSRIGTILGGTYRIVRSIAQGGCGDVYVATHERLDCEVAVKILHPSRAGNPRDLARLRQEADIMSALRHPHIVQILDFNVTERGIPFLVMELLEGRALSEVAAAGTPFDPRTAAHIVDQIGQALGAAHARGIVHLDLKPDNVVLVSIDGRDDFVKVIDFGISRASWRARLANEPVITGTPEYMSPEQARGQTDEINHRADQFALAAVSYRLLTGREPFSGATSEALLYQVMTHTPPPPSQLAPGLGAGVDAVIARGISKRSTDRYPSVTAFAEALGGAIGLVAIDRRHALRAPSARASEPTEAPLEAVTLTFVRQVRRKTVRRRSATVLFALAAALAWFTPATRTGLRTAWHHAVGAKARRSAAVASTSPPAH